MGLSSELSHQLRHQTAPSSNASPEPSLKRDVGGEGGGAIQVTSYFLVDLAELRDVKKQKNTFTFLRSRPDCRSQGICLKGVILVSSLRIQVSFYLHTLVQGRDAARDHKQKLKLLLTGNSQSHQQASKASPQGRLGCFPTYQATFHVSQWDIFIGYSLKLRLVTSEKSIMKTTARLMRVFHSSVWENSPAVRRRPRGPHRVAFEGQFNGPFVFGVRLAPMEASKQRGSDNTIN